MVYLLYSLFSSEIISSFAMALIVESESYPSTRAYQWLSGSYCRIFSKAISFSGDHWCLLFIVKFCYVNFPPGLITAFKSSEDCFLKIHLELYKQDRDTGVSQRRALFQWRSVCGMLPLCTPPSDSELMHTSAFHPKCKYQHRNKYLNSANPSLLCSFIKPQSKQFLKGFSSECYFKFNFQSMGDF